MESNKNTSCVILGGGGHARVLIDTLQVCGKAELLGVLDADDSLWGQDLLGVPIVGGDDCLPDLVKRGANSFVVGVGSLGDATIRKNLFALGLSHDLAPLTVVHPTAVCSHGVTVGKGTVLFPGSIVNTGGVLGDNVIINTGAVVEHDCSLGDHVHVATRASLAGGVIVGEGAHVGIGASVRQNVRIGAQSVIGAGAAVVADVPEGIVVAGVPARRLREAEG